MLRSKTRVPRVRGLARPRLDDVMATLWNHRLGLVVAPAGSGKTTLVTHFAMAGGGPVAWYRAEAADASVASVVAHLEQSLTGALDGLRGGWRDIDDVAAALDGWAGPPALLVVDDLHLLRGTDGEAALGRLLQHLPVGVVMLAACRRAPALDLSRLRVSGDILELGPDDLRFRSWEVEHLFRDFYGERLPPEELAELARRTGGWAAGLQLFHLATRGKPAAERRRLLAELAGQSRLVREYLARNMLDELDAGLRAFLLQTCVLGRVTPELCDELLGRTGSSAVLEDLEHRCIFTSSLEGGYRYHEVLRSHLEAVLVDREGEAEVRARYRRAGALLERAGALADALRAHCRAADWEAATRLLGLRGEQVIAGPGAWIEALPPVLLDHDPWLLLATARRYAALGRWQAAVTTYRRAETGFGAGPAEAVCRRERQAVAAWLEPGGVPPAGWVGLLRTASRRHPLEASGRAMSFGGAEGLLASGLCLLLAGRVREAADRLGTAVESAEASPAIALAAELCEGIALALGGRGHGLARLAARADSLGFPWLAALSRAAGALEAGDDHLPGPSFAEGDTWGAALAFLFAGLGELRAGRAPVERLDVAAEAFREMGATVLEAWARSGLALALARRAGVAARGTVTAAERLGHSTGTRGAVAMACVALATADPDRAATHREAAVALAGETGMAVADLLPPLPVAGAVPARPELDAVTRPRAVLRCFGGFSLSVGGRPVDLTAVKPRPRAVLHLLALRVGRPVHREQLVEAFWPDEADLRARTRNLQVAVSSLRQALHDDTGADGEPAIVREADTYRLVLGEGADVDLCAFEQFLSEAHEARAAGRPDDAVAAFERALGLYTGELLPDDGPADWVVKDRDRYHRDAAEAARGVAEIRLARGQHRAAVVAAERGLHVDPYDDSLWRLLLRSHEAAGDRAGAQRARSQYRAVLQELGLAPEGDP